MFVGLFAYLIILGESVRKLLVNMWGVNHVLSNRKTQLKTHSAMTDGD